MIFSSFNHVYISLVFLFLGVCFGIVYQTINCIEFHASKNREIKNKKINKIVFLLKKINKNIIKLIFFTFFCVFFVIFINYFNFGNFSFVLLLTNVLGFLWGEKNTKTVVFFLKFWYTKIKLRKQHEHKKN